VKTANGISDEFLAAPSHELVTSLTAILGWSNRLATEDLDEQESESVIEGIVRKSPRVRDDSLSICSTFSPHHGQGSTRICAVELRPMNEAAVI
jgi:hypothetical protein